MQEQINTILQQSGYQQIQMNVNGIVLFLRTTSADSSNVAVIIDETTGTRFTEDQFTYISKQIRDFLRQRNCHFSRFLYLLVTEDDNAAQRLFHNYECFWRIVPSRGVLMLYETVDPEFLPLRAPLESLLTPPQATVSTAKKEPHSIFESDGTPEFANCTLALIIINVVIFLLTDLFLPRTSDPLEWGGLGWSYILNDHQYYRIITSMFLHNGLDHIFNNMLVLWVIGSYLEQHTGRMTFLILYFSSGILAGCTSMVYNITQNDYAVSVGASGAIFGVMGALVYVLWQQHRNHHDLDLKRVLLMVFLSLYGGFTSQGVDNAAHIGGFISGLLVAAILWQFQHRTNSKEWS